MGGDLTAGTLAQAGYDYYIIIMAVRKERLTTNLVNTLGVVNPTG